MKTLLMSLTILILATGCDTPQRNMLMDTSGMNGNNLNNPNTPSGTDKWTNGTGGTTGSNNGNTATKPAGFENCNMSNTIAASGMNRLAICQSTLDDMAVAVLSTVSESVRTCLIPTYKDTAGNSTYLGQPQCYMPQANTVIQGKMYKTRTGYESSTVNGVMIMKESSLGAYYTCMDSYRTFTHPACPYGAASNAYCDQLAKSIMAQKCNNFKVDHSYFDVTLR